MKDDPTVAKFFPWALFLVLAILFSLGALRYAHGADLSDADKPPCYGETVDDHHYTAWPECRKPQPKPKPTWSEYTCATVRDYLLTHTEAEARAKAVELHLPAWVVKRAEKCQP